MIFNVQKYLRIQGEILLILDRVFLKKESMVRFCYSILSEMLDSEVLYYYSLSL